MTEVLYVRGDGDYGITEFEDSGISPREAFRLAKDNGGTYKAEINEEVIYFHAYEYGEVDPKFIRFLRNNIIDYDRSKAHDFFIVEEGV